MTGGQQISYGFTNPLIAESKERVGASGQNSLGDTVAIENQHDITASRQNRLIVTQSRDGLKGNRAVGLSNRKLILNRSVLFDDIVKGFGALLNKDVSLFEIPFTLDVGGDVSDHRHHPIATLQFVIAKENRMIPLAQ